MPEGLAGLVYDNLPRQWPPSTPQGRPSTSTSTSSPSWITRARLRAIAQQWEEAIDFASWTSSDPAEVLFDQSLFDNGVFPLSQILEENSDHSPLPMLSDDDLEGWEMFSDSESDQYFNDEPDPSDLFFEATLNVAAATLLLTENLLSPINPMLAEYACALVEGISALASTSAFV